jgi:hypothetical protein
VAAAEGELRQMAVTRARQRIPDDALTGANPSGGAGRNQFSGHCKDRTAGPPGSRSGLTETTRQRSTRGIQKTQASGDPRSCHHYRGGARRNRGGDPGIGDDLSPAEHSPALHGSGQRRSACCGCRPGLSASRLGGVSRSVILTHGLCAALLELYPVPGCGEAVTACAP